MDALSSLKALVGSERRASAELLRALADFEERKLYADLGFTSLFEFLTRHCGYSEAAAYRRVHAARAARRFPAIFALIASGETNMTVVGLLARVLTAENHLALLREARGKKRRRLQFMVANLLPRSGSPDAAGRVCPECDPAAHTHQSVTPFAAKKARISFDGEETLLDTLERAREVLRHKHPAGKLKDIFAEALEALLEAKDRDRKKPSDRLTDAGKARYIPERVKSAVWKRDSGRCVFLFPDGSRCAERGGLEFDHIIPWGLGGRSGTAGNIRLLCRAHNQEASRRIFGRIGGHE